MNVGVIQSNFIPWRGYFDIIADVDLFVVRDDVQYTKLDWRNRNYIRTSKGVEWFTVPVHYRSSQQLIIETPVAYTSNWAVKGLNRVRASYQKAAFFKRYFPRFEELLKVRYESISDLNVALIRWICDEMKVTTKIVMSHEVCPGGGGADPESNCVKTAKLVDLLRSVNATSYLSGPAGKDYIDDAQFADAGIDIFFKVYDYLAYRQMHEPFIPTVSILDLMFNQGDEAGDLMKSQTPSKRFMPEGAR